MLFRSKKALKMLISANDRISGIDDERTHIKRAREVQKVMRDRALLLR